MNLTKQYQRIALLVVFLLAVPAFSATAQDWVTFESEAFDVQFSLPDTWETELDGDTVTAMGDEIVFVLTAVKDEEIGTMELFEVQVNEMDMEMDGEYEEIELEGGILGILGYGVAVMDDVEMGMILLAATYEDNNYLAYIFATPESFEAHEDVMVDIITSLAPLN